MGDQKIPFLGPSDRGFQQLVSRTSHFEEPTAAHFGLSALALYRVSCSILHGLV